MRASELVGRSGKQEHGSSKSREVKLVTVWSAEGRDEEGVPVRDQGSVTHVNEHLSAVGKAIYGAGSDLAEYWTHERCTELKAKNLDAVLAAFSAHFPIKEARECKKNIRRWGRANSN